MLPSVNVPVADSDCDVPSAMELFAGEIASVSSAAGVTVSDALPVIAPAVAVMLLFPVVRLVAWPCALIVATVAAEDCQRTEFVKSWLEPSVKLPIAWNCCCRPSAIEADGGVTVMDTRAAGFTVRMADPEMAPTDALIPALPTASVCASPPAATVAIDAASELQDADAVRLSVLPSVYVPTAVNCCVVPSATDAVAGDTARLTRAAGVIVTGAGALVTPEYEAYTFAEPTPTPVARPRVPGVLLNAVMAASDDVQTAASVRVLVDPSA